MSPVINNKVDNTIDVTVDWGADDVDDILVVYMLTIEKVIVSP